MTSIPIRRNIALVAVAMLAAAACGSSTANDSGGNGDNTACTLTLSGALSGTSSCSVSATYSRTVLGRSDFSILNTGTPGFTLGIETDGQLASGTITQSSSSVEIAVTTASSAGVIWSQDIRDPVHGSISVNLTSVSLGSDGFTFTAHGTADGTLTPSQATPAASGTVTVHIVF